MKIMGCCSANEALTTTPPKPAGLDPQIFAGRLYWPVHLVWMTARLQQDTFLSWHLAPASEVTRGLNLPF
jgi:hypothetical protein